MHAYLSNHVAGLEMAQRPNKLLHRAIEVTFLIEMVSVLLMNICHGCIIKTVGTSKAQGELEAGSLEQELELCGGRFLLEFRQLQHTVNVLSTNTTAKQTFPSFDRM